MYYPRLVHDPEVMYEPRNLGLLARLTSGQKPEQVICRHGFLQNLYRSVGARHTCKVVIHNDQHHPAGGEALGERIRELETAHARHVHIRDERMRPELFADAQGFRTVKGANGHCTDFHTTLSQAHPSSGGNHLQQGRV